MLYIMLISGVASVAASFFFKEKDQSKIRMLTRLCGILLIVVSVILLLLAAYRKNQEAAAEKLAAEERLANTQNRATAMADPAGTGAYLTAVNTSVSECIKKCPSKFLRRSKHNACLASCQTVASRV